MNRSERTYHLNRFINQQLLNALDKSYPDAIATAETEMLTGVSEEERRFAYDKAYDDAKRELTVAKLGECIKAYMDLEKQMTFYLNWTGDPTGLHKELINISFYEFIVAIQNLGYLENYYVAFKIPKKGKIGKREQLNMRVDVISRY